ncbi:MAG: sensor histidine kinase [Sphingomonas sp.]|uniref:sensor histidine kinase n=1 Tax=Sphingomonas sp. TaxID=28214 RepID=UPI003F7D443D
MRAALRRDFGYSGAHDIVAAGRVLLATIAMGIVLRTTFPLPALERAVRLCFAGYLTLAVATLLARLVSWKATGVMRRISAVADEVLGLAVLVFYPVLTVLRLPFIIFLLVIKRLQSSIASVAIEYLILAAIVLLHDRIASFWPAIPRAGWDQQLLQFTMLTFVAAAALVVKMRQADATSSDRWNGELLATGIRARSMPIEEISKRLAGRFQARIVLVCWKGGENATGHFYRFEGDALTEIEPAAGGAERMLLPTGWDEAFLWEKRTGKALVNSKPGAGAAVRAVEPGFLPDDLVEGAAVVGAMPIAANAMEGYVYLVGLPRVSEILLGQVAAAGHAVSATLDRYQMFEAWRENAFANARLDISRDMHDSVLQTLAGLRLQVAVLMKDPDMPVPLRQQRLKGLESIISAEQACLRELVNDSAQPVGERIDLASHLAQRAELLSRQWGIDCSVQAEPPVLPVSPDIALEVEFLVREAVSNAVQHAKAAVVRVAAALRDEAVLVSIRSDGATMIETAADGADVEGILSRSLTKRVKALNGRAYADPMERGVLLSLRIPLKVGVYVEAADR